MILALLSVVGGIAVVLALGWGLVVAGLRTGDQAGDATVNAVMDARHSTIVATVHNPGDVPLVAGFSARRRLLPGWLDAGMTVRVPRRTARRKFRAGAHKTVGVVPAASQAEFRLPVAAPARRYRLTAVVGQAGGRLRVVRIPVVSGGSAGAGRPARAARAGDRG
ncbi:MAG TPA: hypothetical protein VE864_14770 [Streptosporangiaceae bacterium]|nr:hypothetical protein [Streptosporangiaceae bacterium]